MRRALKCVLVLAFGFLLQSAITRAEDVPAIRQKIAQAIVSQGAEQQKMLGELSDSGGSKQIRDVLIAWTRDGVFLYDSAGVKVPVLFEDQQDAEGKARAVRIDNGQFLKDEK